MHCHTCEKHIDKNKCYVCNACHNYCCERCAQRHGYLCTCGGDVILLP